jgi:hypothetical protein
MASILPHRVYRALLPCANTKIHRGEAVRNQTRWNFLTIFWQPDGKDAQEFLSRYLNAMDPGQRARLECHASLCGQDLRGCRVSRIGALDPGRLSLLGCVSSAGRNLYVRGIFASDLQTTERRGEIDDGLPREQEERG